MIETKDQEELFKLIADYIIYYLILMFNINIYISKIHCMTKKHDCICLKCNDIDILSEYECKAN